MGNRFNRFLILILFFCQAMILNGQEGQTRPVRILFVPVSEYIENDRYGSIIAGAAEAELVYAGFDLIPFSGDAVSDPELLLDRTEALGGDFLILVSHSVIAGTIEADVVCYSLTDRTSMITRSIREPVDIRLDSVIQKKLIQPVIRILPESLPGDPLEVIAAGTTAVTDEAVDPTENGQEESTAGNSENEAEQNETLSDERDEKRNRFEIKLGYAGFLPFGDMASYFTMGHGGRLTFGYTFGTELLMTLAVRGGLTSFKAQGDLTSSVNFLIPFGGEVQFQTAAARGMQPFFRIGGGGSLFMINPADTGFLTKIIPYGEAGIGFKLPFTKAFGCVVDLGYSIYFEGDEVLMGFSPGFDVYFSF